jgi:hypothetical protein
VKFNLPSTAIGEGKKNVCEGREKHIVQGPSYNTNCRMNTPARDCMFTRSKKEHAQTHKLQHMTQTRKTENHCHDKIWSVLFKEPCLISRA